MGKIVFVFTLVMLLLVHGSVEESVSSDTFDVFGELEHFDLEDDEIESEDLTSWSSQHGSKILVNVDSFGAAGDGVADDTKVPMRIVLIYATNYFDVFIKFHCVAY